MKKKVKNFLLNIMVFFLYRFKKENVNKDSPVNDKHISRYALRHFLFWQKKLPITLKNALDATNIMGMYYDHLEEEAE